MKHLMKINEASKVRIVLTEEDFTALVNGKVASPEPNVEIILQDIGYDRMQEILDEAKSK